MTEEQLRELDGLQVRLAPWVTCEHLGYLGLTQSPTTFLRWRDSAVFKVRRSYMHETFGRVAELDVVSSGLYWPNYGFIKWCFLELVVTSKRPSQTPGRIRTLGEMWSVGSYTSGNLSSYPSSSPGSTFYFPPSYFSSPPLPL